MVNGRFQNSTICPMTRRHIDKLTQILCLLQDLRVHFSVKYAAEHNNRLCARQCSIGAERTVAVSADPAALCRCRYRRIDRVALCHIAERADRVFIDADQPHHQADKVSACDDVIRMECAARICQNAARCQRCDSLIKPVRLLHIGIGARQITHRLICQQLVQNHAGLRPSEGIIDAKFAVWIAGHKRAVIRAQCNRLLLRLVRRLRLFRCLWCFRCFRCLRLFRCLWCFRLYSLFLRLHRLLCRCFLLRQAVFFLRRPNLRHHRYCHDARENCRCCSL